MYDFLGYYDICYIGGEVRNPERVLPRAIILSVIFVALIYSVMNLAMISVVPWREAMKSPYIAAEFMERIYGGWAGTTVTLLILWTSAASIFALILGYSRIPYAAALDGYFFSAFAKLHPTGGFPHVSLLVIGVISILASLVSLGWVIDAMLLGRILIQFIGQIGAVHLLRTRRPDMERPFRIWLYPFPSLVALVGWMFLFVTAERQFILFGLGTLAAGVVAFAVWRPKVAVSTTNAVCRPSLLSRFAVICLWPEIRVERIGNDRPRGHKTFISNLNRRNERGVASYESAGPDPRRMLADAVVIAGNRPSADVGSVADLANLQDTSDDSPSIVRRTAYSSVPRSYRCAQTHRQRCSFANARMDLRCAPASIRELAIMVKGAISTLSAIMLS